MRSVSEMIEAQRFLERYASTPVRVVDREQAQANLRRIGILTADNKVSAKYANVIVKTEAKSTKVGTKKQCKK